MMKVDRPGTFRARVLEHAVTTTRQSELPQWTAKFLVTEFYDAANEAWETGWEQYDMQIMGYMTLIDKGMSPTFNVKNIMEAIGWDGKTYASLDSLDLIDTIVQIQVAEDLYNGVTQLKVQGIAAADADPVRKLKRLDGGSIKKLDANFGASLNQAKTMTPAKPPARPGATAPAKPAAVPSSPGGPNPPATSTPASRKRGPKPKADAGTTPPAGSPPSSPTRQSPPKPPTTPTAAPASGRPALPKECTQEEAWAAVMKECEGQADEQAIGEFWLEQADTLAAESGVTDQLTQFTPANWATIRDAVIDQYGIPF